MPFKSEKQRRYLHLTHPKMAKEWEEKYGRESAKAKDSTPKPKRRRLKPAKSAY